MAEHELVIRHQSFGPSQGSGIARSLSIPVRRVEKDGEASGLSAPPAQRMDRGRKTVTIEHALGCPAERPSLELATALPLICDLHAQRGRAGNAMFRNDSIL